MIKGKDLIKIFKKQIDELHFWNILQKKKLRERIDRVHSFDYYTKDSDGTYRLVEFYDPDLDVRNKHKSKKIVDGNECVGKCLNCRTGVIFEIDPIEKIGQCHHCFTEFKLL